MARELRGAIWGPRGRSGRQNHDDLLTEAVMKTPKTAPGADVGVGYGRPPLHSRFKPGTSGNPRGRPRGSKSVKTHVNQLLHERVVVSRNGKKQMVTTLKALLMLLTDDAFAGDARARELLIRLAQTYDGEEPAVAAGLSAEDQDVLDVFIARVRSGATAFDPNKSVTPPTGKTIKTPHNRASKTTRMTRMRLNQNINGKD